LIVAAVAGPQPKFPNDWSAYGEDTIIVVQGPVTKEGTKYCCESTSDCQVQVQHQAGNIFVDYSHNRTRFDDKDSGESFVNLFTIQKELLVVGTACKEYCPMEGDTLDPGFLFVNATDKGAVVLPDGRKGNQWEWQDKIFDVIVMETIDVYVNQDDMKNGVPLQEIDHLTPFGEHIGDMTQNWKNFVPGTPDPSKFAITGIDTCPMSPNCNQQSKQINRLRANMKRTWLKSYQEINMANNNF